MLRVVILFNLCMATCFTTVLADDDDEWILTFNSTNVNKLEMGSSTEIAFSAYTNTSLHDENLQLQVISSNEDVAYTHRQFFDLPQNRNTWTFSINLTSEFLGYTKLYLRVVELGEYCTIFFFFVTNRIVF